MKHFIVFFLFCFPGPWFSSLDARAEHMTSAQAPLFPARSVVRAKLNAESRGEVIRQLIGMRQKTRRQSHPVLKNSTYVIDAILQLLKYGLNPPGSYYDVLLAKADLTNNLLDGFAMISQYGENTHIDLMVVAPWNLNTGLWTEGIHYSHVGKAMIEHLLLNGSTSLTLDAASAESYNAFYAMGFRPIPNAKNTFLSLEGDGAFTFLQSMKEKRKHSESEE
jgi:hypothetical protein